MNMISEKCAGSRPRPRVRGGRQVAVSRAAASARFRTDTGIAIMRHGRRSGAGQRRRACRKPSSGLPDHTVRVRAGPAGSQHHQARPDRRSPAGNGPAGSGDVAMIRDRQAVTSAAEWPIDRRGPALMDPQIRQRIHEALHRILAGRASCSCLKAARRRPALPRAVAPMAASAAVSDRPVTGNLGSGSGRSRRGLVLAGRSGPARRSGSLPRWVGWPGGGRQSASPGDAGAAGAGELAGGAGSRSGSHQLRAGRAARRPSAPTPRGWLRSPSEKASIGLAASLPFSQWGAVFPGAPACRRDRRPRHLQRPASWRPAPSPAGSPPARPPDLAASEPGARIHDPAISPFAEPGTAH